MMRCAYPTKFPNTHGMLVPCGQCMPCRINKKLEKTTRLLLEYKVNPNAVFVTLTYSPEYLPDADKYLGGNLVVSDVQKFMKRLRRRDKRDRIRHFAVGEYGELSMRAHYHLILFDVDLNTIERLCKESWKFGFVMVAPFTGTPDKAMRYVSGYVTKKATSDPVTDGRNPEFSLSSKHPALGTGALPAFADMLLQNNKYPARYFTDAQKHEMQKFGLEFDYWDGVFMVDSKFYRFDDFLMRKLGEIVDKKIGVLRYLDRKIQCWSKLDYSRYKVRLGRIADNSRVSLFKDIELGVFDVTKETEKKLQQNEKNAKSQNRKI